MINVEVTDSNLVRLGDLRPGNFFINKNVDKNTVFLIIDRNNSNALEDKEGGSVVTAVDLTRAKCINFVPVCLVTRVYQVGKLEFKTVK